MVRFPMRTLVLMVLALLSFVWFWWQMHRVPPAPVQIELLTDGGQP
jgi:hypothetical protein